LETFRKISEKQKKNNEKKMLNSRKNVMPANRQKILHKEYKLDYDATCSNLGIKSFPDGRLLLKDGFGLWVVAFNIWRQLHTYTKNW